MSTNAFRRVTSHSNRRRAGRLLTAVVAGSALLAAVPAVAQADPVGTTYAYRNLYLSASSTTGTLMLDVSGGSTSPGAPVVQWWLNGGANQKWNVTQLADGNHEIVNVNSGQCLTTDGVAGHGLFQWPCYGGPGQEWSADLSPSGTVTHGIRNPGSGLFVDIYGNNSYAGGVVDAWYGNGGSNQYFFSFQG